MRFAPETLFVFLGASASVGAVEPRVQEPSSSPTPSPSPTPRYKLVPYGFESARERSAVPLLRFEDKAEVRALEMNAAIARFFDQGDEKGNMLRGSTPGGAPTRGELGPYRPHVSPSLNFLGLAALALQEIRKQIRNRERDEGEDLLRTLLLTPSPTATPIPWPSPSPSPTPTPTPSPTP